MTSPAGLGADALLAVLEALPVGVLVWQPDGRLMFANGRAIEITGRAIAPGLTCAEVVAAARIMRAGTRELHSAPALCWEPPFGGDGTSRFDDAEVERPDGRRRSIEGWTAPGPSVGDTIRFGVTAFADVTEQRRSEQFRAGEAHALELIASGVPLVETLDALARMFESMADDGMMASILLVEGGRVRHAAAPRLPTAWIREVDGMPIGPDQGSCGTAAYLKKPVIVSDIATDPRWLNFRDGALTAGLRACWSVPILGHGQEVVGTFAFYYADVREPTPELLDLITHASHIAAVAIQHHRHEEASLESEARARLIIENALDANVLMDADGSITGWNARATAMFGWSTEEAIGQHLAHLIIPERFRADHEKGLARYLATGEGAIIGRRLEVPALRRNGEEFPVQLSVTPIQRGDRVMFSAFIEDVAASRQAERALLETEQYLSLVYEHVADVLFQLQIEPEGYRFVAVNPAFVEATGMEPIQVIGRLVTDVIPEPSLSLVLEKYAEAIRTRGTVRWAETTNYPKGERHGDVAVTPVFDAEGRAKFLIGSVRDVTEQKRMEDDVRQLQRLEAIGRLSGGIAHDFNNLLGVIVGVGNMLLRDIHDPDLRSQVEEIILAGQRGADLTRQFLAFGRKQVLRTELLDLTQVIRNLETMLRRLIRADITLTSKLEPGLWRVMADPGQIEQVVVNLVANARDAMPIGGTITIETSNVDIDAAFARSHPGLEPGPGVLLSVRDTGEGMDEETRKRIFEPFFTTKPLGQGTGLGLATVYGIVKQTGGYIRVLSVPGEGANFEVYLPRSAAVHDAAPAALRSQPGSGEKGLANVHILVVEDEPALRRAIERMLLRLKCQVTMAASGEDALAIVTEKNLTPDVLMTDMVMPGMSGNSLAERLGQMLPGLKILRMSGYAYDDQEEPGVMSPGTLFLQKPFTLSQLADALQSVVESR